MEEKEKAEETEQKRSSNGNETTAEFPTCLRSTMSPQGWSIVLQVLNDNQITDRNTLSAIVELTQTNVQSSTFKDLFSAVSAVETLVPSFLSNDKQISQRSFLF